MSDDIEIIETHEASSDDLGAQLQAAHAEVMAKHDEPVKDAASSERPRDEAGRFAKQETLGDKPAPPAPAVPLTPDAPIAAAAAPVTVSKPPESLSAAIKAKWDKLDPDVRTEWERREADFHKGATKFDEERHYARTLKQLIEPFAPMFQSAGVDTMTGLRSLLNAQATFERGSVEQRAQLMGQLARQYNIDLGQVQALPQPDPAIWQLQNELSQVRGMLQQFQTQGQEKEQSLIASDIEAFQADPANSLFEQVRDDMSALLKEGRAASLKDAYDKAVWMNPATRSAVQAQADAAKESQRKAEAAARVDSARRKAVSVTGAPGLSSPASAPAAARSLDDELRANLNAAMGRI